MIRAKGKQAETEREASQNIERSLLLQVRLALAESAEHLLSLELL
jgi:hypothetical protein